MTAINRILIAGLAGGIASLGHAPSNLPYLAVAAFPVLIWCNLKSENPKEAGLIGLASGTLYFALSLRWLLEPFAVEADIYGWLAPFALGFMSVGLALFWGLAFYLSRKLQGLFTLPVIWALAELLREYLFTGFPWAKPSYIFVDTSFAQLASFIGPTGLFFVMLGVSALVVSQRMIGYILAFVITMSVYGLGVARVPDAPAKITDHVVRIVQPNAPQAQKWDPKMKPIFFDRLLDLSKQPGSPDLVLWPETSIPFWYGEDAVGLKKLEDLPIPDLIAGIREYTDGRVFNTVLHFKDGKEVAKYRKHHLVPFGEYVPFASSLGLHGLAAESGAGFSRGQGPITFNTRIGSFLPLICYEAIFPRDLKTPNRPDWIAHLTNDAWFGFKLGPQQHLAQVQFRAIETGLPVARSANTGISAMIDPYGRITAAIPLDEAGFIDAALPEKLSKTIYATTFEYLWLSLALLVFFIQLLLRNRSFQHKD